ncbi:MAG: hypothetical protein PQJ50_07550, partial [Spirochaetales bacterium]|nr:hypothetical protein [Spirochaetales bacterium]
GKEIPNSTYAALEGSVNEYSKLHHSSSSEENGSGGGVSTAPNADFRPLQTDPRLNQNDNLMAAGGCHFLSALGVAQTATGLHMTIETIDQVRNLSIALGVVTPQLHVHGLSNVSSLIDLALLHLGSNMRVQRAQGGSSFRGANASILYGTTINGGGHYREGDGRGRYMWDPYSNEDRDDYRYVSGFQTRYNYRTRFFQIGN